MDPKFIKNSLVLVFLVFIIITIFYRVSKQNITGFIVGTEESQTLNGTSENLTAKANSTNETAANATSNVTTNETSNTTANQSGGPTGGIIGSPAQNATNVTGSEINALEKPQRKYAPNGKPTKVTEGWVLKKELSSTKKEDEFAPEWEYVQDIGNHKGTLVAELRTMIFDNTKLTIPKIQWSGGYLNLTFEYKQEFEGRCFQMGIDILFSDGTSDTTDFLTFNNTGFVPEDSSDYNVSAKNLEDNWISIEAVSKSEIDADRQLMFFVQSLCTETPDGQGKAYISNFVYSAV